MPGNARELADGANGSRDEFLAILAHELSTPVTAMLGWIETLRGKALDPAVAHALQMIEHSVNSQRRLIDDLLDVSRIDADHFHVEREYVASLQPLTATVAASLHPQALAKGILLELSMPADVGPVEADPHRLQQVISNLLSNAIAFTPSGGRIQVRGARDNDRITLAVSDSGQGISPEALRHVFERFWQEKGAQSRQRSLGLGLTIAGRIVALHGGRITAASEGIGHGATFTVSLPICRRAESRTDDHRSATNAHRSLPSMSDPKPGLRVLLVEDDDGIAKAFERLLTWEGYIVLRAASIEEGASTADQQEVDVLVCDLTLADGSGLELLRRIRPRLRSSFAGDVLPAIATSGGDREGEVAACLAAGFALHVPKPFDGPTLIAAIRRITQPAGAAA
jgi:CheY-like chemotaxis protein